MNQTDLRGPRRLLMLLGLGSILPLASAQGALEHRYSLNGDGTDSITSANGTLNNPGGTASFSSTALTTTNANGTDYLALPAFVGSGITGDFSVEDWLTQSGAESAYTSIFSLSTSQSNFILLNPNRNGTGTTADFEQPGVTGGGTGTETNVNAPGTSFKVNNNFGTELQIVLTYVSSTGVASMYNNATLLASANIGSGFSFQSATAGGFDGIGGGDAYIDPDFMGSTDDFRIYSQALTPRQISALDAAGANATTAQINAAIPEPATLTGLLSVSSVAFGRRFRRR